MRETGITKQTLSRWRRMELDSDAVRQRAEVAAQGEATLDDELERLARQIVEILPEKLYEANLHQIIEAFKFILDKVGQAGDGSEADVYEKLARLMDRYATEKSTDSNLPPTDED
jgi:hypothetical protein